MQAHTSPRPRPQDWEILKALESLSPPSPSPSLGNDFLATLASTGEIPIYLDLGEDFFDDGQSLAPLNASPENVQIPSNPSLETVGTFGPKGRFPDQERSRLFRNSYLSQDSLSSSSLSLGYASPPKPRNTRLLSPRRTHEGGYYDHRTSQMSQFTISSYLSPPTRQIPGTLPRNCPSPSQSPWTTPSPSCETLSLPGTSQQTFSIGNSLSTIIFAAGSGTASPTLSTTIATEAQEYVNQYKQQSGPMSPTRLGAIDVPPSSPKTPDSVRPRFPTTRPHTSRPSSPLLGSPTISRGAALSRKKSTATTRSSDSGNSSHTVHSSRSTKSPQPARIGPVSYTLTEPPISVPGLPFILSWLENICLELWIDQEGFRLIRPVFSLSGYSTAPPADRDLDLADALTFGSAEFRPVQSQSYIFHRGNALEPPPALRKITVVGDDKRDYISRQASLTIKDNGIYSVSGTESFDCGPPVPHGHINSAGPHEPLRLKWRFDYVVDDRPADGASKMYAGERTLTPLAFSCSPGLVHPTHGKKIRIMHVVRKNLIPKLTSERLDGSSSASPMPTPMALPPAPVRIRVQTDPPPQSYEHHRPDADPVDPARFAKKHRRAHSSAPRAVVTDENQEYAAREGNRAGVKKNRAVSVAIGSTLDVAAVDGVFPGPLPLTSTQRPRSLKVSDPLFARHILPPTELAELLNGASTYASDAFASLRPPPRKTHG